MKECFTCGESFVSLNTHYKNNPEHKPDHWPECPNCGEKSGSLGHHWKMSEHCGFPTLSDEQRRILTGMVMGDAWVQHNRKMPIISVEMIEPDFLSYIDQKLGVLSTGVSKRMSGSENAAKKRRSGFDTSAKGGNYSDIYQLNTRIHPEFTTFANWYSSGEKVFPENIELSPLILKMWYVCDGTMQNKSISINCSNERGNEEKINRYFKNVGLPEPNRWSYEELPDRINTKMYWNVSESLELFEYMGSHPPGFGYKWI